MLCVSSALPFVECVVVWALKLPVPHTNVLKPTRRKAFLFIYRKLKRYEHLTLTTNQLVESSFLCFQDNSFYLLKQKELHRNRTPICAESFAGKMVGARVKCSLSVPLDSSNSVEKLCNEWVLSTSVCGTGSFSAHTATHSTSESAHETQSFSPELRKTKKCQRILDTSPTTLPMSPFYCKIKEEYS